MKAIGTLRKLHQLVASSSPSAVVKTADTVNQLSNKAGSLLNRALIAHENLPAAELTTRREVCDKAAADALQRFKRTSSPEDMRAHTGHLSAGLVYYHTLVMKNRQAAAAQAKLETAIPKYEESSDDELAASFG